MNQELIEMVLAECHRRALKSEKQAMVAEKIEDIKACVWERVAYSSVVSMLEYALAGNYECLTQFMTEEPE